MKIQIEINEEQFKELLENELKDLPKEDIQQVLLESIRSYLHNEDITEIKEEINPYNGTVREPAKIIRKHNYDKLNAFLIREEHSWGGSSYKQPSNLFESMLKQCDFSGLQDIVDDMIKDLKENYHSILVETISKRIADSFLNDYRFTSELTDIIQRELNCRNN